MQMKGSLLRLLLGLALAASTTYFVLRQHEVGESDIISFAVATLLIAFEVVSLVKESRKGASRD